MKVSKDKAGRCISSFIMLFHLHFAERFLGTAVKNGVKWGGRRVQKRIHSEQYSVSKLDNDLANGPGTLQPLVRLLGILHPIVSTEGGDHVGWGGGLTWKECVESSTTFCADVYHSAIVANCSVDGLQMYTSYRRLTIQLRSGNQRGR